MKKVIITVVLLIVVQLLGFGFYTVSVERNKQKQEMAQTLPGLWKDAFIVMQEAEAGESGYDFHKWLQVAQEQRVSLPPLSRKQARFLANEAFGNHTYAYLMPYYKDATD